MKMYVSSSGGHLAELLCLKSNFANGDVVVTERVGDVDSLQAQYSNVTFRFVIAGSRKRKFRFLFIFLLNCLITLWYLIKYRPDAIISTGSHTFVPFVYFVKILPLKSKLIYIESIARVYTMSKTGKIVINRVDYFYVQWPEMLKFPNTEYIGRLL